jgi:hypothetical protein
MWMADFGGGCVIPLLPPPGVLAKVNRVTPYSTRAGCLRSFSVSSSP